MRMFQNGFVKTGVGLIFVGTIFSLISWQLLNNPPLIALSTGTIVLGVVSIGLGNTSTKLSPETSLVFLEAGMDNITSIIEELGLKSKAIYIPSDMNNGFPKALIPLFSDNSHPLNLPNIENRFLVLLDKSTNNYGIMVATPGSMAVKSFEPTTITDEISLEESLRSIIIGNLDLASRVLCVQSDGRITIELSGVIMETTPHPAYETLGSPVTSICAAIAAEVLHSPVILVSEEQDGKNISIELLISSIK